MDRDALSDTLRALEQGEPQAVDRLLPFVYAEMRRLAAHYLRGERAGHTLQPTALANEAYLRLAGDRGPRWSSRTQFLCVAARAMRGILVDHARRRKAQKRGGGAAVVPLDTTALVGELPAIEFDDLDRALTDLAKLSERQAHVVELRYFGGLTIDETAVTLGVAPMTVKRDWALARAWLFRELTR